MRSLLAVLLVLLGFSASSPAQTCTGLCTQQVSCPSGTTTVTGTVYAPNGVDPLPNVIVYVPNAPVDGFTPGVSCPVVGQPPSGSPLVGATTAVDGTFTIPDMPVGANIPLVIVSGRWRRQVVIPSVTACTSNPLPSNLAVFPQNQSQGDIPKFAVATGAVDAVECVLRKVGIADSEFTDPSGTGRINLYKGTGSAGAQIDPSTPSAAALLGTSSTLNSYDVLMLPCEGGAYPTAKTAAEYANLISFADAGGRVYSSHYSYQWMYQNPPFNTVANWAPGQTSPSPDPGPATINTGFSGGAELSQWLQLVGASTTPGQIQLSTLKRDMNGVIAPSEDWINLNSSGTPVMQMVFDTPVGATNAQCGRVLFNEYHVEAVSGSTGLNFPSECTSGATMSPQEKLLEYSLFELTNDGSAATLIPATQDFGTEAIGFNSPVKTFTWTNNSTFSAGVTLLTGSGDFAVAGSNCGSVAAGGSCSINVVFNPTAIGARAGTLTVGSSGTTLISSLTGTGIPDLTISSSALNFGSLDVGASAQQTISVTNGASGTVSVPGLVTTGDYSASSTCGNTLAAGASCSIIVTFKPTTNGMRAGTLAVNSANPGTPTVLSGNGVDFNLTASPTSGTVIAGDATYTVSTTTPLSGFAANLKIGCTTPAPGSTCVMTAANFTPTAAVSTTANITTTSQYAVIGYGGFTGWLSLLGFAAGVLLWLNRRRLGPVARSGLTAVLLAIMLALASVGMTGCSGKTPAQNANYSVAGTYTYTITATDGFLVHSATYSLTITPK